MEYDIDQLKKRLENTLKEKRYQHSLRVCALAQDLADFWRMDQEKAAVAGLLHDVARGLSNEEMFALAEKADIPLDEDILKEPVLLHAPLGAYILEHDWGIRDGEILEAVRGHTLAEAGMKPLSKIIFLADMLAPGRDWQGIDQLRVLIYQDLDRAMLMSIECQLAWLKQEKKHIHPTIYRARRYYQAKIKEI